MKIRCNFNQLVVGLERCFKNWEKAKKSPLSDQSNASWILFLWGNEIDAGIDKKQCIYFYWPYTIYIHQLHGLNHLYAWVLHFSVSYNSMDITFLITGQWIKFKVNPSLPNEICFGIYKYKSNCCQTTEIFARLQLNNLAIKFTFALHGSNITINIYLA